jgi:hypothetical protein
MPSKSILTILNLFLFSFLAGSAIGQKPNKDLAPVDSSFEDYDVLFSELDAFLDSLLTPRSYFLINTSVTNSVYNFGSKSDFALEPKRKLNITPSLSYFHKSGLGIYGSTTIIDDGVNMNPYVFLVSGTYDYVRNRNFITGISASHFFTKDSLPFYTSPLQNELYAYFTYRNFWVRPSVAVNYGWGSRTAFEEREEYITSIRLRPNGFTKINTQETIADLTVTASLRKDFYWLDVLTGNDFVRLTPQIAFTSGTQRFGFNQTTKTYGITSVSGTNVLYNSDEFYLDDQLSFQPLSLSGIIKTEFSKGKFFIQPQFVLDYYFPAKTQNLSTIFSLNAGVIF